MRVRIGRVAVITRRVVSSRALVASAVLGILALATPAYAATTITVTTTADELTTNGKCSLGVARLRLGAILTALISSLMVGVAPLSAQARDAVADGVIGQPDFVSTQCNRGGVSARSLCRPFGVTVDPNTGRLYVADTDNNRVLSWRSARRFKQGDAADLVLGQPDFKGQACNLGAGEGGPASARGLCFPEGLTVGRGGVLYVADSENHRVLAFDRPRANGQAASLVLGQADFASNTPGCGSGASPDASARAFCFPRGVAADQRGLLFVVDTFNDRVLRFANPHQNGQAADLVLGQANFPSRGGCEILNAHSMCEPTGAALDRRGSLYVADELNSRVLRFTDARANGQSADLVLGQPDFVTRGSAGCGFIVGHINARNLCGPRTVAVNRSGALFVADRLNSRVLLFEQVQANNQLADAVIGQPDFTTGTCNLGGVSARSLCEPFGVAVDRRGDLLVADTFNKRVLRFDRPDPRSSDNNDDADPDDQGDD